MKRVLLSIFIACGIAIFILLSWGTYFSYQTYVFLKSGTIDKAGRSARLAEKTVGPLSLLFLKQNHDLNAWYEGLKLISTVEPLYKSLQDLPQQFVSADTTQSDLKGSVLATQQQFTVFTTEFNKSWVKKVKPDSAEKIHAIENLSSSAISPITTLLSGSHRIAIMLQNTDEVRATGGFMGSFVVIDLREGALQKWQLYDIYEPDGQFTGYMPAPQPVDYYLSEGKGLRLPDSNWWPDFANSRKFIAAFLLVGKIDNVDYLGAVNLSLIQKMLAITGPVELPDQNTTITTENVNEILRSERGDFFAGSQAKKVLLLSFTQQLLLKTKTLSAQQQQEIAYLLIQGFTAKDIQLFSQDPPTQNWLEHYNLSGALFPKTSTSQPHYFASVESNVGINKANKYIERTIELKQIQQQTWEARITFTHTDSQASDNYVNYHRVYLPQSAEISQVLVNNVPTLTWDQGIYRDSQDTLFQEVGTLVTVNPGKTTTISFTYTLPFASQEFAIGKQSGITAPFYLTTLSESENFVLTSNRVISLPQ